VEQRLSPKMMTLMKERTARRAEKALKEILDKADSNTNGRVELRVFISILERNGIEMKEEELETFGKLIDENGEISKTDMIMATKQSSFWKGHGGLESKSATGSFTSKVEVINAADNHRSQKSKTDTAFGLFDKNRDGFITKDEFAEVSKKLSPAQIDAVFAKYDANKDGKLSKEEFRNLIEKR